MPAEIAISAKSLGDGCSSAVIAIYERRHRRSWAPPIRLYRSTATARARSPPSGCCRRHCGSSGTSRRLGRGAPRSGEIGRDDTHESIEIGWHSPRSRPHFAEIGAQGRDDLRVPGLAQLQVHGGTRRGWVQRGDAVALRRRRRGDEGGGRQVRRQAHGAARKGASSRSEIAGRGCGARSRAARSRAHLGRRRASPTSTLSGPHAVYRWARRSAN